MATASGCPGKLSHIAASIANSHASVISSNEAQILTNIQPVEGTSAHSALKKAPAPQK